MLPSLLPAVTQRFQNLLLGHQPYEWVAHDLLLPAPVSPTALFTQSPNVTVRLVNSDGACWEADFPAAGTKKNTAEQFQAGVP
jgi:hypothetical protein